MLETNSIFEQMSLPTLPQNSVKKERMYFQELTAHIMGLGHKHTICNYHN